MISTINKQYKYFYVYYCIIKYNSLTCDNEISKHKKNQKDNEQREDSYRIPYER